MTTQKQEEIEEIHNMLDSLNDPDAARILGRLTTKARRRMEPHLYIRRTCASFDAPMPKRRRTCTVHQRIMRAHRTGRGVTLSAAEIDILAVDDAISSAALLDDLRDAAHVACNRHTARNGHRAEVVIDPLGYSEAICRSCSWQYDPSGDAE